MMTTKRKLKCPCGHEGFLVLRENDQPFAGFWEKYSLEGFQGSGSFLATKFVSDEEVVRGLVPSCPECGTRITAEHILKGM